MRISNGKAIAWLLKNGYNSVYLKAHTKWNDTVYCIDGNYKALDLFNLWDGIVLSDKVWFVQIKTNAWAKEKPIIQWCKKYKANGMIINVKLNNNDDWNVMVRKYEYS